MIPGWPAQLQVGPVGLRPIRLRDGSAWREVRARNEDWLRPWEPTVPPPRRDVVSGFGGMVRFLRAEARAGRALPFVVTWNGRVAGQLTVGGIGWGSLCSGHVGYWLDSDLAGRGIVPTAVALAVDHSFGPVGLHRIEVNIRPENAASLRVVEKLGFRDEGVRQAYLHIDGAWRDHRTFALTREDVRGGLLERWRSVGGLARLGG